MKFLRSVVALFFLSPFALSLGANWDYKTLGPDIPTQGSSLFDFVFSKKDDQKTVYDVPYPYDRVVQRLKGFDLANFSPQQVNRFAFRMRHKFTLSLEVLKRNTDTVIAARAIPTRALPVEESGLFIPFSRDSVPSQEFLRRIKDVNAEIGMVLGALLRCSLAAVRLNAGADQLCAQGQAEQIKAQYVRTTSRLFSAFYVESPNLAEEVESRFLRNDPNLQSLVGRIDLDIGSILDTVSLLKTVTEPNAFAELSQRLALKYSETLLTRVRKKNDLSKFADLLALDLDAFKGSPLRDLSVWVPFGRSLQKPIHSNQEPLKHPRELIAPDLADEEPLLEFFGPVKGRIFCGHFEVKESLECISYNDQMGRFEYQLIEDYARGKQPRVRYVDRKLCMSCHHNQTPIFPTDPWPETQDNFPLQAAVLLGNAPLSQGIKTGKEDQTSLIRAINARFSRELFHRGDETALLNSQGINEFPSMASVPGRFDRSVFLAVGLNNFQLRWEHLCGDGEEGRQCRRQLLKVFFVNSVTRDKKSQRPFFRGQTKIDEIVKKTSASLGKFPFASPFLGDRSVFTESSPEVLKMAKAQCRTDGESCGRSFFNLTLTLADNFSGALDQVISRGTKIDITEDPKLVKEESVDLTANFSERAVDGLAKFVGVQDLGYVVQAFSYPRDGSIQNRLESIYFSETQGKALDVATDQKKHSFVINKKFCKEDSTSSGTLNCATDPFRAAIQSLDQDGISIVEVELHSPEKIKASCVILSDKNKPSPCYPFSLRRLFGAIDNLELKKESFHRAKILAEIISHINPELGQVFREQAQREGPEKILYSGEKDLSESEKIQEFFIPDPAEINDPLSFFARNACVSCHGVGAELGSSSAPQFLAVKDRNEMEKRVRELAPQIIEQLWRKKSMPPIKALRDAISPQDHALLKNYLSKICTGDSKCRIPPEQ